ncbi:site-specific integrase [Marinovum sp.]|uniref:tyrosine-type recombinase/integrase n=1 Tax=Marinovum sp. TaxID=2024839 RepID=UPI002B265C73|nr:site-specific integrase [Marinovum sp.]
MTTISDSTKNVLAMITAQQAARGQAAPAWEQMSSQAIAPAPTQDVALAKPATKRKAKAKKSKKTGDFEERHIARIANADGRVTYRVQIRRKVNDKSRSLCHTFSHLRNAKKWRDKRLAEIELHGFPIEVTNDTTVADVIADRLKRGKKLGKSALQNLEYIRDHEFGQTNVALLTQQRLYDFAGTLLDGDRTPQTVAGYMTHLAATLKWAHRRGTLLPIEAVSLAMETLWEDEVLARSNERNRRPQLAELDAILNALVENRRQKLPVAAIVVFAIYSGRRLGEICRLRWEDLREDKSQILVRDMKHPRKKKGNDVWCKLPPEALAIIQAMPRTAPRIFPFSERSIGTAYARHRDKVGITDLRFHDLRHEAISRRFEMGEPASFVAKFSGHKNGGCLYRYEHVEEIGDKFAGWPWFDRVLKMCRTLQAEDHVADPIC